MLKREAPDTKLEEVPVSRGEDGGSLAGGGSDSEMDTGEDVIISTHLLGSVLGEEAGLNEEEFRELQPLAANLLHLPVSSVTLDFLNQLLQLDMDQIEGLSEDHQRTMLQLQALCTTERQIEKLPERDRESMRMVKQSLISSLEGNADVMTPAAVMADEGGAVKLEGNHVTSPAPEKGSSEGVGGSSLEAILASSGFGNYMTASNRK